MIDLGQALLLKWRKQYHPHPNPQGKDCLWRVCARGPVCVSILYTQAHRYRETQVNINTYISKKAVTKIPTMLALWQRNETVLE